jgi:predicted NUDIX family phosphoesterase
MADDPGRDFLQRAFDLGRFEDRPTAERTPAWKQWIPYCVLRCGQRPREGHAAAEAGVFLVQRTRGQSEARLHGAFSLGLGGHIEPDDAVGSTDGPGFFLAALWRELHEELQLGPAAALAPRFVGLVNDDSTEVGSVHAGLVYTVDVPLATAAARQQVGIREVSKMHGGFTHLADLRELWQNPACFESWSRMLLEAGLLGILKPDAKSGYST